MFKQYSICISCIIFVISLVIFFAIPKTALGAEQLIFDESFDNLNNWNILSGDASQLLITPGLLTNYSVDLRNSSYLITKNSLPSVDLKIVIKLRAVNSGYIQGAGVAVSDSYVAKSATGDLQPYQLTVNVWPNSYMGPWGFPSAYSLNNSSFSNVGLSSFAISAPSVYDWHEVSIIFENGKYKFINGSNEYVTLDTSRAPKYIWIGNPLIASTDQNAGFTKFQVDSIKVWQINMPSTDFSPYYSQKNDLWKSDLYDDSPSWAGADKYGIDRWGCALSSVAMVLGKYDIKSPTGETSTPKVLNFWLKNQSDGYIGNGLINWLAITRYSKLSETAGFAPHSLEYTREPYTATTVATRIADSKYPILPLNGHYTLNYAIDGDDLIVADPNKSASERVATSSAFSRMNVLSPSHTDLSYMMFVGPSGTGFSGGGIDSYTESISDDVEGTSKSSVVAIVPKPTAGTYNLHVTGSGSWTSYFYDQSGNVSNNILTINGNATDYQIVYDPVVGHSSSITPLDSVAPVVSINSPTNASYVKTLVDISGSITDDNPDHYQLTISNSLGETVATTGLVTSGNLDNQMLYVWDTTLVSDGTYSIILQATDVYANSGSTSVSVIVDNTTPTLSIIDPPIIATDSGVQTWSWTPSTDSGSGVKGYYTRSHDVVADSHPTDWLWLGDILSTTTLLNDGVWEQEVKSEDNAGNISPAAISGPVFVDHSIPVLYSKTTWNNDWYNTPQTAYFDYTDNNLVGDYIAPNCQIANEGFFQGCSITPHVCDNSSNCNTTTVWSNTIKLDSTKPKNGITLWGSQIAGWASDNMSGIVKVEVVYRKDNGEEHTEVATGRTSWSYSLPSPVVGTYDIAIYSYDVAGNRSDANTKTFMINPSDPPRHTEPATSEVVTEPTLPELETNPGIVLGASIIPTPTPNPIQTPEFTPTYIPSPTNQQSYWPYIVAVAIVLPFTLLLFMILRR